MTDTLSELPRLEASLHEWLGPALPSSPTGLDEALAVTLRHRATSEHEVRRPDHRVEGVDAEPVLSAVEGRGNS